MGKRQAVCSEIVQILAFGGFAADTTLGNLLMPASALQSNFTHLKEHDEQLLRLGMLAACAEVERLTPATSGKAFRSELVKQAPNDEPASVLLERVKAAAAAPPKSKKARSTS